MYRICLALLLSTLLWTSVDAQEAGVDPRGSARAALEAKDFAAADAFSRMLLARNGKDADALLIRAVAAKGMGRIDVWQDMAVQAYQAAENDFQRFDAAMLAGEAAARQENFTRAQIWLRRADQYAPEQARAMVENAYRQTAARNPLSVQVSFGLTPSDNVNNGGETTTIEIAGLPFSLGEESLALGGYEATLGVSLAYRLSAEKDHRTDALLDVFGKKVWLNSQAKEDAPGVEGSDFDYGAVVVGVRHRRSIWEDVGLSQVTGLVGQSWSGGQKQAFWQELQFQQTFQKDERNALNVSTSLRNESRNGEPMNDSQALGMTLAWSKAQDEGRRLSYGGAVKTTWSDSATVDNLMFKLFARQGFSEIGGVVPTIGINAETRDYRKWVTTVGGRRDNSVNLRLDVTFPSIRYFGFVPQATVQAGHVWSDVDIYDRKTYSFGLTAVSRF